PIGLPTPPHHLRIERLTHAQDVPQAGKIESLRYILPRCQQHAERRGSAVPDVDPEALDGFVPIGGIESAATNQVGCAIEPGRKNAVRRSRYPAGVSSTPI